MKIIHFLKSLFFEHIYRRHIIKKKYQLSEKGKCLAQYLIDKYLNETKPDDYIEAYEANLREKVQQWRKDGGIKVWFLPKNAIPLDTTENTLYIFATLQYLTVLLSTASEEEQQYYCNQITNPFFKDFIAQILKNGHINMPRILDIF